MSLMLSATLFRALGRIGAPVPAFLQENLGTATLLQWNSWISLRCYPPPWVNYYFSMRYQRRLIGSHPLALRFRKGLTGCLRLSHPKAGILSPQIGLGITTCLSSSINAQSVVHSVFLAYASAIVFLSSAEAASRLESFINPMHLETHSLRVTVSNAANLFRSDIHRTAGGQFPAVDMSANRKRLVRVVLKSDVVP